MSMKLLQDILIKRRRFLVNASRTLLLLTVPRIAVTQVTNNGNRSTSSMMLFLCGDVMTGRGVDQILPHPGDPHIHEYYLHNAKKYVEIAEEVNGQIPTPVDFSYIWGDALAILDQVKPDVRIINLETSITKSNDYWLGKGIHYRMNPENIPCITAADIDCCVTANNHVLDWGYQGLVETLTVLRDAGVKTAGAGPNLKTARAPAVMEITGKGRVIVFAFGSESSGIAPAWGAGDDKAGVNLLPDLSNNTIEEIGEEILTVKQPGDIVVASIHWGSNWGYDIPDQHMHFAHGLIDVAGVDIIHGHSSHHPLGIEVYRNKPVIYGCGDFLNDYEGIGGNEKYRGDLALMYFVQMEVESGKLIAFHMVPTQIEHFKSNLAADDNIHWLRDMLNRECKRFGSQVEINEDRQIMLSW